MTFGEALNLVKNGCLVAREGWNGKGMFIFMRPGDSIPLDTVVDKVQSIPSEVKMYLASSFAYGDVKDTNIKFTPYLCMKAADNTIVNGWLASQTDMLADDWYEL
jgi:hypothetical protein